jgi:hypothetical protein
MGCLNAKNSNSYCSSEGKNRSDKKTWLAAKKISARDLALGTFGTWHLALGTWHSNSYCSSEAKNRSDKKKLP